MTEQIETTYEIEAANVEDAIEAVFAGDGKFILVDTHNLDVLSVHDGQKKVG